MTTKRFLPGVLLVIITASPAAAQFGGSTYPTPKPFPGMNPSITPGAYYGQNISQTSATASLPDIPAAQPGTGSTPLDRVTSPIQSTPPDNTSPFTALTGQPAGTCDSGPNIPKGAYPGFLDTDIPACCGPIGHDGRISYETYVSTGPTIPFGAGDFAHRLELGWMVGAGGHTLFFNQAHDAAWVGDLGFSYQYNRGNQWSSTMLNVRQGPVIDPSTGQPVIPIQKQPDILTNVIVRDIDRTNFNFGIGRDWWLWGPGATGLENDWNLRVGAEVGGRWGTAHTDLVPVADPFGYIRRQGITHGVFIDFHANLEVPLGTVIFFSGVQVQYGYDWTNIAPPYAGDIQNVNVMLSAGLRF
jgi:hypothetical protein